MCVKRRLARAQLPVRGHIRLPSVAPAGHNPRIRPAGHLESHGPGPRHPRRAVQLHHRQLRWCGYGNICPLEKLCSKLLLGTWNRMALDPAILAELSNILGFRVSTSSWQFTEPVTAVTTRIPAKRIVEGWCLARRPVDAISAERAGPGGALPMVRPARGRTPEP